MAAPGCLYLSSVFQIFWHSQNAPQQETKLEKDCIQSLEENLCNFQEARNFDTIYIVLDLEKEK